MPEIDSFTGARKAAIFLAAMGADVSAKVFKTLDEAEIETLSTEISRLPNVDEGVTADVLREFMEMALTKQYITTGGLNYALEILEKALGKARAVEVVGRIQATVQPVRFSAVRRADPNQLASILRREHPQMVALILANLEAEVGASIVDVGDVQVTGYGSNAQCKALQVRESSVDVQCYGADGAVKDSRFMVMLHS